MVDGLGGTAPLSGPSFDRPPAPTNGPYWATSSKIALRNAPPRSAPPRSPPNLRMRRPRSCVTMSVGHSLHRGDHGRHKGCARSATLSELRGLFAVDTLSGVLHCRVDLPHSGPNTRRPERSFLRSGVGCRRRNDSGNEYRRQPQCSTPKLCSLKTPRPAATRGERLGLAVQQPQPCTGTFIECKILHSV